MLSYLLYPFPSFQNLLDLPSRSVRLVACEAPSFLRSAWFHVHVERLAVTQSGQAVRGTYAMRALDGVQCGYGIVWLWQAALL